LKSKASGTINDDLIICREASDEQEDLDSQLSDEDTPLSLTETHPNMIDTGNNIRMEDSLLYSLDTAT